jgi:hypothetical protein
VAVQFKLLLFVNVQNASTSVLDCKEFFVPSFYEVLFFFFVCLGLAMLMVWILCGREEG